MMATTTKRDAQEAMLLEGYRIDYDQLVRDRYEAIRLIHNWLDAGLSIDAMELFMIRKGWPEGWRRVYLNAARFISAEAELDD